MTPPDDDLVLPAERRSPDTVTCAAACGCLRSMAASALRRRFADIRDARKRLATYRSVTPRLDQLRHGRPHLFPPGLLRCAQPATIGKLLCPRHHALCARATRLSNPRY